MDSAFQAQVASFWPKSAPVPLNKDQIEQYRERIKALLVENNAVIIAHYYVDAEIQRLAEETGGCVADSLQMARFGAENPAKTLVVSGVKFMGETAKILSPEKTVIMPTLEANCSLDISCPADDFKAFIDQHPDRTVVVYANTSAAVKAHADWVVTSSNALEIISHLDAQGEKILWAPDKYLGAYIQQKTDADMVLWQGSCVVHEEFKANALAALKKEHPDAGVLVHPESPMDVVDLADVVGSTSQLLKAVTDLPNEEFIVATDRGIFYKMQQLAPTKRFISAPTGGQGGTCKSCAHCPWMDLNSLKNLCESLELFDQPSAKVPELVEGPVKTEIHVDEDIAQKALISLQRMVDFKC